MRECGSPSGRIAPSRGVCVAEAFPIKLKTQCLLTSHPFLTSLPTRGLISSITTHRTTPIHTSTVSTPQCPRPLALPPAVVTAPAPPTARTRSPPPPPFPFCRDPPQPCVLSQQQAVGVAAPEKETKKAIVEAEVEKVAAAMTKEEIKESTASLSSSADHHYCEHAPECTSRAKVVSKFGYTDEYDADTCCRTHSIIRDAVHLVFAALRARNIICFLECGSVIGVRRHEGMQIPWEHDADIGFLIDGQAIALSNWREVIAEVVSSLGSDFSMNDNHPPPKESVETLIAAGIPIDGSTGRSYCSQIQVRYKYAHALDLFGYVYTDVASYESFIQGWRTWPKQYDGGRSQNLRHMDRPVAAVAAVAVADTVAANAAVSIKSGTGGSGSGGLSFVWYLGRCYHQNYRGGFYIFPRGKGSLSTCPFYNTTVSCPGNIDGYLKGVYGPDVLKTALTHKAAYARSATAFLFEHLFHQAYHKVRFHANTLFHRASVAMHTRVSGHEKVVVALSSGLYIATFFVFAVVFVKKLYRLELCRTS